MNTPFADRFGESARRYVARIGSLYEKARSLVAGSSPEHGPLAAWEWHRTSAQACVDEAVLIYIEGLETLLAEPVEVRCIEESSAPRFTCLLGESEAGVGFEVQDGAANTDSEAAMSAAQRAFGKAHNEVLAAFAEGLQRLHALGAFRQNDRLKLQPEVNAGTDATLSDLSELPR